jgi:transcriptional regulator with XRE-family HTH domain
LVGADISGAQAIGAALAAARRDRGWSLADVAGRTRVRVALIEQMESGDFSGCGGAIYARGHLRSIAASLGVDGEPLVAAFNREFGGPAPVSPVPSIEPRREVSPLAPPPETPPMPAELASFRRPALARIPAPEEELADAVVVSGSRLPVPTVREPVRRHAEPEEPPSQPPLSPPELREPRRPRWLPIMAAAAAVLVLVLAITLLHPSSGGKNNSPSTAASTPATHRPTHSPTATKPPLVAYSGVNLRVRLATSPSWMSVSDDTGAVQLREVLPAGTVRDFRSQHEIDVIVGNAGAVELACNGHYLGFAGTNGQVVRLVFALSSPACGGG